MKKRIDISALEFVEFSDEYKPKFIFTDKNGEKMQIEMSTDGHHAGISLLACLLAFEKHIKPEQPLEASADQV